MEAINVRSVILYHVYPVNNWKAITSKLLTDVPHDDIYVHVNIEPYKLWQLPFIMLWFKRQKKVREIFFSLNIKAQAEVIGFKKLREAVRNKNYTILSYMHGKGVTKPGNKNIRDWVELMRYFIIDRMSLCLDAFNQGYKLYGVNIGYYKNGDEKYGPYRYSSFHFSGNFVTINLRDLNDVFFSTEIDEDYFGVEGFWGKLCSSSEAFCPHLSNVDHYQQPYPGKLYQ